MSEVRTLIEELVTAGVDPIHAAEVVTRAAIHGAANAPKERSAGAIRQERYRRNKASQSVTSDADRPDKETPPDPQKKLNPSPKENPPKGGQKKRASRLPADWEPGPEFIAEAERLGLPSERIAAEAAKMRDWSRSSRNGAKLDWLAAWRNWVREAVGRQQPRGSPSKPLTASQLLEQMSRNDERSDQSESRVIDASGQFPRIAIGHR